MKKLFLAGDKIKKTVTIGQGGGIEAKTSTQTKKATVCVTTDNGFAYCDEGDTVMRFLLWEDVGEWERYA